jgi:tetratricopeptide (TPR) repeat protein
MELSGSPNIRVPPYGRLLQIIRRFIVSGDDVSNPEAVQAITEHTAAQFILVPTLMHEDGRWHVQAEIRDALTSTRVDLVQTDAAPSALVEETAYAQIGELAGRLEEYFKDNGPGKRYELRQAQARPRSINALRSFEEGINAFEQLEFAAAERSFLNARELDSRNPLVLAWLSRVKQILRRPDEASEAAESAWPLLTSQIPHLDTTFVNAVVAEARQDDTRAEREYRNLIAQYPDEPLWLAELGGFQDRREQTEPAIRSYQQALMLDPRLPRPDIELCRLYNRSRDSANAVKHARQALEKYTALRARDGEAQALFCLSDALRAGTPEERQEARGVADSALAIVEELKLPYNLPRAYYYVGLSRAEAGDVAGGVAFWERGAEAARTAGNRSLEPLILMNLGVLYARVGNRQRAMDSYLKSSDAYQALGEQLRAAQVQTNRAQLRIDFGDNPDEAARDANNALNVFIKYGDRDFEIFSRQALGAYSRYLARYQDAETELNRALSIAKERKLTEDRALLTIDLARSHFDRNDYPETLKLLESVGDGFGQNSLHAWIRLARTQLRLGNFDAARALLQKAGGDGAKPQETEYLALLYATSGELEYETGRLTEARAHFNRAAELWADALPDPASVEAKAYVGLIDALQGRVAPGRRLLEASLAQAGKMRQVAIEVRCRVFLARVSLSQRRPDEALATLSTIVWDGPGAVGLELLAQARYWRASALSARGDRADADIELEKARKLLDGLTATLAERDRQRFAMRPDIRQIAGQPVRN